MVSYDVIVAAALVGKKEVNGYSEDELLKWKEDVTKKGEERAVKAFPYVYNVDDMVEAHLEDVSDSSKKSR